MTDTRRRPIVWLAVLIGLSVVVLVAVRRVQPLVGRAPFDRGRWLAGKTLDYRSNPRHEMVISVVAGGRLRGKTKAEVVSLLGSPDGVGQIVDDDLKVSASDAARATEFDYIIGTAMVDYEYLGLHFDTDGRVSGWEFWQS